MILAYFTAKWCGPCQHISPIVSEFSDKFAEKFEFLKIDLDENEEISDRFNVDCIPTFLVLKNGEVVETLSGANQKGLQTILEKNY
ncbi:unnamed protein product [Caenorhabditis angaria]|uniref:Thioredoxin domain-containing protein n=1 Tax=Caenorhabditis angaria TaxID=860376 RepID=A0A9P1MXR3_9PELO|nr:unnamed protein product [Caenorhabditis angaria]